MCRVTCIFVYLLIVSSQSQTPQTLHYSVSEGDGVGSLVGDISKDANLSSTVDSDKPTFSFSFSKTTENAAKFTIDENTGVIRTRELLDRDSLCEDNVNDKCQLKVDVVIKPVKYFQIIHTVIEIMDINDNAPVFAEDVSIVISESSPAGSSFMIPPATDRDVGSNGITTYRLQSYTDLFKLKLTPVLGGNFNVELILLKRLDREISSSYQLQITAYDGGVPPKTGKTDIMISVQDVNDNNPQFVNATFRTVIKENIPINTRIIKVKANDEDSGINGKIIYSFSQQTEKLYGNLFDIDRNEGHILVKGAIDYEKRTFYHLNVIAQDQGVGSQPARALVIVSVKDVNDNAPRILLNVLNGGEKVEIIESDQIGSFVVHLAVSDADTGENGRFDCSLTSRDFKLHRLYETSTQFKITLNKQLDYETKQYYDVTVRCQDQGEKFLSSEKDIRINIIDENDNAPKFKDASYFAEIEENNVLNAFIIQVVAADADSGKNGEVVYRIENDTLNLFRIDQSSGNITAAASLDREKTEKVNFTVTACDRGATVKKCSSVIVTVNIIDQNDCKPAFTQNSYNFTIYENAASGSSLGIVWATDADKGSAGVFHFLIDNSFGEDLFDVDPESGKVSSRASLDRETTSEHHVTVYAIDRGTPSLTGSASVTVYVLDRNDNPPVISYPTQPRDVMFISDAAPLNSVATTVHADDPDRGDNAHLSYFIFDHDNDENIFRMDEDTGDILVSTDLSKHTHESITLHIVVKDNGVPSHNASAMLQVYVNHSLIIDAPNSAALLTGQNLTIIIVIASITFVITVILITAIILLTLKKKPHTQHLQYIQNITGGDSTDNQHEFVQCVDNQQKDAPSLYIDYDKNTVTKVTTKDSIQFQQNGNCDPYGKQLTDTVNTSTGFLKRKKKHTNNRIIIPKKVS